MNEFNEIFTNIGKLFSWLAKYYWLWIILLIFLVLVVIIELVVKIVKKHKKKNKKPIYKDEGDGR